MPMACEQKFILSLSTLTYIKNYAENYQIIYFHKKNFQHNRLHFPAKAQINSKGTPLKMFILKKV
jgi:hypothetical protein